MDKLRERLSGWYFSRYGAAYRDDPVMRGRALAEVDAILAEIRKTHRLVRLADKEHGTYTMYTNGRCRCDLCRQANTERGRRYRKEKNGE